MARKALIVLIALLAPAVAAPGAQASTYRIYSCQADTFPSGGKFSSKAFSGQFVTRGMILRRACSPNGPGERGLMTGNRLRKGRVAKGSRSIIQIIARPGTRFRTFKWLGRLRRADCRWAMALYAVVPGGATRTLENLPANQACPGRRPQRNAHTVSKRHSIEGAERIVQRIDCVGRGRRGCAANRRNYIKTLRAVVEVADNAPPSVEIAGGDLVGGQWVAGARSLLVNAADTGGEGSGIRTVKVQVGQAQIRRQFLSCNNALVQPCPGGAFDVNVSTARAPEGIVPVRAGVEDRAGNPSWSAPATAYVDNTPPAKVRLGLEGGEGWRRSNGFAVAWENLAEGRPTAPIAGAAYSLCRPDGGGCQAEADVSGANVSRAGGIAVPGGGEWVLALWRRDSAGNTDRSLASEPVRLRFDPEAPRLAIRPLSLADPTALTASVSDPLSGVGGGGIEISRAGSGTWRALSTRLDGGVLRARLDDSGFPAGRYALRAVAADRAGNTALSDRRADGTQATIDLPLRIESRLRAGFARKRGRVTAKRRVRRGRRTRIAGRLRTPDRQAIPFATVRVLGAGRLLGSAKTDRGGRFSLRVRARVSTPLQVTYGGSAVIRPALRVLDLQVPAASSLGVSRRRILNGRRVVFGGRLARRAALPAGKLVELQTRVSGRWQTFRTTRANARGRWRVPYRFLRTKGLQSYRFRARLPREAGYPYATGATRTITVTVRGR